MLYKDFKSGAQTTFETSQPSTAADARSPQPRDAVTRKNLVPVTRNYVNIHADRSKPSVWIYTVSERQQSNGN